VFSFYLSKKADTPGKITLGGYSLEDFAKKDTTEEDVNWVQILDDTWKVPISGF